MERLAAPQTHLSLKAMIKEVDEDQDGKLSFREVNSCNIWPTFNRVFPPTLLSSTNVNRPTCLVTMMDRQLLFLQRV